MSASAARDEGDVVERAATCEANPVGGAACRVVVVMWLSAAVCDDRFRGTVSEEHCDRMAPELRVEVVIMGLGLTTVAAPDFVFGFDSIF